MNVQRGQITVIIMEFVSILTEVITVMIVNQALLERANHVKVRSFYGQQLWQIGG